MLATSPAPAPAPNSGSAYSEAGAPDVHAYTYPVPQTEGYGGYGGVSASSYQRDRGLSDIGVDPVLRMLPGSHRPDATGRVPTGA
jgi:hypothetical protein